MGPCPLTQSAVLMTAYLPVFSQLVEELLAFWSLEDYEASMEELEEVLIVGCNDDNSGIVFAL